MSFVTCICLNSMARNDGIFRFFDYCSQADFYVPKTVAIAKKPSDFAPMFSKQVFSRSYTPSCLRAVCLLKRVFLLFVILYALPNQSWAQRSFDIHIIAERLDLGSYFPNKGLDDLQEVYTRTEYLQDSMGLDSTNLLWQKLFMIRIRAAFLTGKPETQSMIRRLLVLTENDKGSYLHRIALLHLSFTLPVQAEGENALEYLFASVKKAKEAEDAQLELDLCLHIADMYIDLLRRDLAREWTDRAEAILPKVYSASNCQAYYVVAADVRDPRTYDEEGKRKWETPEKEAEALEYIHKAIECGKQAQKEKDAAYINVPLGYHIRASFWRTPDEHVFYFQKTLGESRRKKDEWAMFWGRMRLATAYLTVNRPDTARLLLDTCRITTIKFGKGLNILVPFYSSYYDYHKHLGQTDSMLKYLQLKYEAEKEMAMEQTLIEIERNKEKYFDAEQKITILEQEADLSRQRQKQRNLYLALGIFLLTALLLGILVIRIRSSNKTIKQFAQQQEENAKEKTVLVQEVNHRVKNNLQMITTFIDMQAQQALGNETLEFGNGIRKRVRAVSLVHELMLEEDRLTGASFEEYVKELVSELESIHYAGEEMRSHLHIAQSSFGLSATMYLGILLNELVSNSIKHASVEGEVLELWIDLEPIEKGYVLRYADSGPGIPDISKLKRGSSLGLYIVRSMARQMEATLSPDEKRPGGIKMEFPAPDEEV